MEPELEILKLSVMELVENYREMILKQEEAGQLSHKQRKQAAGMDRMMKTQHPELYRMVADYISTIYELNSIYQEQLYIQGVKDGIRIRKLIKQLEGVDGDA